MARTFSFLSCQRILYILFAFLFIYLFLGCLSLNLEHNLRKRLALSENKYQFQTIVRVSFGGRRFYILFVNLFYWYDFLELNKPKAQNCFSRQIHVFKGMIVALRFSIQAERIDGNKYRSKIEKKIDN